MQFGDKDHLRFLAKYDPDNKVRIRTVKINVSDSQWHIFKQEALSRGKTAQELLGDLVILVRDLVVKEDEE